MDKRKPKLLIIGHARHGKDSFAELMSELADLNFASSSVFVGTRCIWPHWGKERYANFAQCFDDRVNHRALWGDLIAAYCTPDKARIGKEIMAESDMYVGLRRSAEYIACMEADLFDHVIWIDACERLPLEDKSSNEMTRDHADMYIDNNGPEENLRVAAENLREVLFHEGYDVGTWAPPGHGERQAIVEAEPEFQEPELEERLEWTDKPINAVQVLDHGFFEVKEVMCSDIEIAESARMSYGRGTRKVNSNKGLINYLVRNKHTSPLEMGEIRFHMRLPIFVMRQLVRHRTANLNEYSGRYSEMVRLFYTPELSKIMCQGLVNKQMSGDPLPEEDAQEAQKLIQRSSENSFDHYEELLRRDVSRETARIVLPLNTYTECVWKMDISNLIKFLYLRDDDHAQWEIRVYARLIGEAVEHFFPLVYEAYMRERESISLTPIQLNSLISGILDERLSKSETAQIERLLSEYA